MGESEWEELKYLRKRSGLSWNMFIRELTKVYKDYLDNK
jgi:hypothetical protein